MSRIGKQPVVLPKGVKASLAGRDLKVEGPKGKLSLRLEEVVDVNVDGDILQVALRPTELEDAPARFGLTRNLIANMVKGVSEGFTKELEINGTGFRANAKGKELELSLGFSHPVAYPIPDGITIAVEKQTRVIITGADRQLVGQTAAEIRQYRKPEPYKGKGVKYSTEKIRRKAGKAAAGAAGGAA